VVERVEEEDEKKRAWRRGQGGEKEIGKKEEELEDDKKDRLEHVEYLQKKLADLSKSEGNEQIA
jgi:hypothetical protein